MFAAALSVRATALVARTVLATHAGPPPGDAQILEGHTRRDIASDTRDYVFVVNLTNRSTAERRFPEPALRVTYRTRANFLGAVDLTSSEPVLENLYGEHRVPVLRRGVWVSASDW